MRRGGCDLADERGGLTAKRQHDEYSRAESAACCCNDSRGYRIGNSPGKIRKWRNQITHLAQEAAATLENRAGNVVPNGDNIEIFCGTGKTVGA